MKCTYQNLTSVWHLHVHSNNLSNGLVRSLLLVTDLVLQKVKLFQSVFRERQWTRKWKSGATFLSLIVTSKIDTLHPFLLFLKANLCFKGAPSEFKEEDDKAEGFLTLEACRLIRMCWCPYLSTKSSSFGCGLQCHLLRPLSFSAHFLLAKLGELYKERKVKYNLSFVLNLLCDIIKTTTTPQLVPFILWSKHQQYMYTYSWWGNFSFLPLALQTIGTCRSASGYSTICHWYPIFECNLLK